MTKLSRWRIWSVVIATVAVAVAGCGRTTKVNSSPTTVQRPLTTTTTAASTPDVASTTAPEASATVTSSSPPPTTADATCSSGQIQGTPPQAQGSHNSIAGPIYLRNTGAVCAMHGFPTVTLLDANGRALPEVVARSNDTPTVVTLPGSQPPVPANGNVQYAHFQLSGTNVTQSYQPCPAAHQEQPAALRITFPGGASFTVSNHGTANFGPFSSCDGRIEVGPIRN